MKNMIVSVLSLILSLSAVAGIMYGFAVCPREYTGTYAMILFTAFMFTVAVVVAIAVMKVTTRK